MKTIKNYITKELVDSLAIPSNVKYGTAIYKRGGVEVIKMTKTTAEARVGGLDRSVAEGGSQRRTTKLQLVGGNKITWRCTESAKPNLIFCKHCVALALEIMR